MAVSWGSKCTCRIQISSDDRAASLTVQDDGHGAPPHFAESGLTTLRHRVRGAGGRIDAANHAAGGFEVAVEIPLTRPEDGLR
ncbi:hypothetical protein [Actinomadura gamaensis]|uniref:Histidine kinase/HSP90-like ATPase domain-containing protein n=1 Tax=Actinomadura gamaensis TaxID=1763541 RepID=A0ABV9U5L8_9ACTN